MAGCDTLGILRPIVLPARRQCSEALVVARIVYLDAAALQCLDRLIAAELLRPDALAHQGRQDLLLQHLVHEHLLLGDLALSMQVLLLAVPVVFEVRQVLRGAHPRR